MPHKTPPLDDGRAMRLFVRNPNRLSSSAAAKGPRGRSGNVITRSSDFLGGRLNLAIKLSLLIALLTVPSVLAGTSYVGSINARASVASKELAGTDVLRPALNAMVDLAVANGPLPDFSDLSAAVARHPELGLADLNATVKAAATGRRCHGEGKRGCSPQ